MLVTVTSGPADLPGDVAVEVLGRDDADGALSRSGTRQGNNDCQHA